MSISLKCAECKAEFKGKDKLAGKRVKCPKCGATIKVPGETPDAPNPVPEHSAPSPSKPAPAAAPDLPPLPTPAAPEAAWKTPQWTDDDDAGVAGNVPAVPTATDSVFVDRERASLGIRLLGYIIDLLPTFLVMIIALIPFLGQILAGLALIAYWMLRDIGGASLGKLALGYEVVLADGQPSTGAKRIIRNLPFTLSPFIIMIPIPFLSLMVGAVVGAIVMLTEMIFLLATGRRGGDILAGTIVVKK